MRITGIMIYYLNICKRKLWYFCNSINMESENTDVQLGKQLDEYSYGGSEKHINIGDEINIDFISNKNVIHEVKKSRKIEQASVWQVKYYIYYLKKRGVENLSGEIDYPLLKKITTVSLSDDDEKEIERMCGEIEDIARADNPPCFEKKGICKACAYYDLCGV